MSNFDAQQQKQDEELDKRLNICVGADAGRAEATSSIGGGVRCSDRVRPI